jgi:hypothetical protein
MPVFMLIFDKDIRSVILSKDTNLSNKSEVIIKFVIPPFCLFTLNAITLCIAYFLPANYQILIIFGIPLFLFIVCLVMVKKTKYRSISWLFFITWISYAVLQQAALIIFWLKVASRVSQNGWDIFLFLFPLALISLFFYYIIGNEYAKNKTKFSLSVMAVLLSILFSIVLYILKFDYLTNELIKNILEVRAPDGNLCVMLYQKDDLNKNCEEIQKNEMLSDSFGLYKIGSTDRLRIPLGADGIFYVNQFIDAVKGQESKLIPDIHLVPISKVTMICGCPSLSQEPSVAQSAISTQQPAASELQSATSAPQCTASSPQPASSAPQPTASAPQSAASKPQPTVQHPPRQQRRYHRNKRYRCGTA